MCRLAEEKTEGEHLAFTSGDDSDCPKLGDLNGFKSKTPTQHIYTLSPYRERNRQRNQERERETETERQK